MAETKTPEPQKALELIKRFSSMLELMNDVTEMRHYQKSFFREKENPKLKGEYLAKSKEYEKKVDGHLAILWKGGPPATTGKLF